MQAVLYTICRYDLATTALAYGLIGAIFSASMAAALAALGRRRQA